MTLRTNNTAFLAAVDRWWIQHLLPAVKPLLYVNDGGPVVSMQLVRRASGTVIG